MPEGLTPEQKSFCLIKNGRIVAICPLFLNTISNDDIDLSWFVSGDQRFFGELK